jgi:DNA-binding PadR family transcriptional regulator
MEAYTKYLSVILNLKTDKEDTMNSDTLMLYKLMILYILSRVNFPLTNAQLTAFILEKGYTNYFNIQQVLSDLLDDAFITVKTIRNSSLYRITDSGLQTLQLFDNLISQGIKDDIETYLRENKYELQEEVSTPADYYQMKKGEFAAHLSVIERSTPIIDLTLVVTTEEEAIQICNNWKDKSSDVYSYLMSSLLGE